ncbi:MAG: serine/threonine-protein phosphatase [Myxococcales bacterium]|nr:serine/threonine-protein phosphatase [Myxococcales bacterium]
MDRQRIQQVIDQVATGELSAGVATGILMAAFAAPDGDASDETLYADLAEGARVQDQLHAVGTESANCHVEAWTEAASLCSGDCWLTHATSPSTDLLLIADVSGHGVQAALVGSLLIGAAMTASLGSRPSLPPSTWLSILNRVAIDGLGHDYLISAVAVQIDLAASTLEVANAGHPPPLLIGPSGVQPIRGHGSPPLGAVAAHKYQSRQVPFGPMEVLALFTDGVREAQSPEDAQFGDRRLWEACTTEAMTARSVCEQVRRRVRAHRAEAPWSDDITFLAVDLPYPPPAAADPAPDGSA